MAGLLGPMLDEVLGSESIILYGNEYESGRIEAWVFG